MIYPYFSDFHIYGCLTLVQPGGIIVPVFLMAILLNFFFHYFLLNVIFKRMIHSAMSLVDRSSREDLNILVTPALRGNLLTSIWKYARDNDIGGEL
jgi:hypothetical protein